MNKPDYPPPAHGFTTSAQCPAREDLLIREKLLRSDIRFEREFRRQLALAQAALEAQRQLFNHSETCPACRRMGLQGPGR